MLHLNIGETIVIAVTFEEYKKLHPHTKKKADDPLFDDKGSPKKSGTPKSTVKPETKIEIPPKRAAPKQVPDELKAPYEWGMHNKDLVNNLASSYNNAKKIRNELINLIPNEHRYHLQDEKGDKPVEEMTVPSNYPKAQKLLEKLKHFHNQAKEWRKAYDDHQQSRPDKDTIDKVQKLRNSFEFGKDRKVKRNDLPYVGTNVPQPSSRFYQGPTSVHFHPKPDIEKPYTKEEQKKNEDYLKKLNKSIEHRKQLNRMSEHERSDR